MVWVERFWGQYWPLLWPVVLGFLAVYWRMPRPRAKTALLGVVAGAAALGTGACFLLHAEAAWQENVLFYTFAGIAVFGAGLMITQQNPVHAALSFALVVLATCGLFLLLGAPFLFAATLIIYAGAIVVTFLFVLMLAQQAGLSSADARTREPFLASLAGFLLIGALFVVVRKSYDTGALDEMLGQLERLGHEEATEVLSPVTVGQFVDRLGMLFPGQKVKIDNLETLQTRPEAFQTACRELLRDCRARRNQRGSLWASEELPLAWGVGVPANRKPKGTGSAPREGLPAANVTALGKTLFSDYLVAVEMAGVLLLVASIGAIVIAGQRPEGRA